MTSLIDIINTDNEPDTITQILDKNKHTTMNNFYIRFTNDIYEDIERGHSYFKGGAKLDGLCAWTINDHNLSPYATKDEIVSSAKKTAEMILKNTYASYSDNSTYAVLRADYAGSDNDGVLIKNVEVISIETI